MIKKKKDSIFAYVLAVLMVIASIIMTIINRLNGDNE